MKRAADGTLLVQVAEGGATQPVEITGQPIDVVQLATDPLGVEKKAPMSGILFTTTTPINTGITYDSGVLDARNFQQVQTHVRASHDGSMQFIFCSDAAGTNIVRSITVPYTASDGFKLFSAPCFSDYVQYKFTNDSGTNQTSFLWETKVLTGALSGQVLDMTSFISPAMTSALTRSVIVAQNTSGTYSNVQSGQFNDLNIAIRSPLTAFGELRTAQFTPVAQFTFPYIINDRLWDSSSSLVLATMRTACLLVLMGPSLECCAGQRRAVWWLRLGPALIYADNGATTSDIIVRSASIGLFSEGRVASTATTNAFSGEISGSTTEQQIFSLRAKVTFGAHENHVQTFLKYVNASMSSSGNRNATIRLLRNPTLSTPSWTDVATTSSQLEIDTAGTLTGGTGTELFTITIASNASIASPLTDLDLFLSPGDVLTVSGQMGTSTGDISASLNVLEDV